MFLSFFLPGKFCRKVTVFPDLLNLLLAAKSEMLAWEISAANFSANLAGYI
jgi:hypothetical protein